MVSWVCCTHSLDTVMRRRERNLETKEKVQRWHWVSGVVVSHHNRQVRMLAETRKGRLSLLYDRAAMPLERVDVVC